MRRALLLAGLSAAMAAAAALPVARAADSDAPPGAPPNWLPPEEWVNLLWLPFDEARLPAALHMTRGQIFSWIRNDGHHNLAQLAHRRGLSVDQLARRLVANRRSRLSARNYRIVLDHTRRVIRQGHLAQHLLFHALHQTAIPDRARWIFGTRTQEEYLRLRRQEVSPLEIGELHGVTRVQMRRRASAALRSAQRRGVRAGLVSARQARVQLDRQVRQIPRWLGQNRYNGPPPSVRGMPKGFAADFAKRPSISADGSYLVWDAYRAHIPTAETLGEIHVVGTPLGARGAPTAISRPANPRARKPHSSYNSVMSADAGAVAFEVAESTYPLAKRVGQMSIFVRDLRGGGVEKVSALGRPPDAPKRTAYNPTISGDGNLVAFEATDSGVGGAPSTNALWVADRAGGSQAKVAEASTGAAYLPRLASDGRAIAFTAAGSGAGEHSQVYVRPLAGAAPAGPAELVSRTDGREGVPASADAYDPAVSADGGVVAFASQAANLGSPRGRARVYVRDVREGVTQALPLPARESAAHPAISADGRFVAYATRRLGRGARLRSRIWLHDRVTGATELVSRRTGPRGGMANGYSSQPAISADGRRVAFTSTAGNLGGRKPAGLAGVYVRDFAARTTTLVSRHRRNPSHRRARQSARAAHAPGSWLCRLAP